MARAALWRDGEGVFHPKAEISSHHVFPRCQAHGNHQRQFINQHGLVLPMLDEWHNKNEKSLHKNVGFPPMPGAFLMYRINEFAKTYEERRIYDRFLGISEFIADLAINSGNDVIIKQATRISENLQQQTPFILQGMVYPVIEERRNG